MGRKARDRLNLEPGRSMSDRDTLQKLAEEVIAQQAAKDGAYLERNKLVALLATLYPSGIKRTAIEGWSEDWHGCVYIDFPWGQASWHYHDSHAYLFAGLPAYAGVWDGHSTEKKYAGIEYATRLRIGLQKSQKNPFAPRGRGMLQERIEEIRSTFQPVGGAKP